MLIGSIYLEIFWVIILSFYAVCVFFLTEKFYYWILKKVHKKEIAIYYNRKLIHIFAGGVILLVVPFVFPNPWYPLIFGILLASITYIAHKKGNVFFWFQTKDNLNDVTFCLMWGVAIFVLWQILGNPWIAIIPPAFMAFGDGITGIVRNLAFKERKKHPIGNLYMAGFCIIIGYYFGSLSQIEGMVLWGVIAAIAASIFERFEFGPIDDNILITVISTVILYLGSQIGSIF